MVNNILSNRLMNILEKYEDDKYFIAATLFGKLCEQNWIEDHQTYTVSHGYSHVCSIFRNIESILGNRSDNEIIELLGIENIFMLASAIYIHDLGMHNYYSYSFKELAGRAYAELTEQEKMKVRFAHSETIDLALSDIKSVNGLGNFFNIENLRYIRSFASNNEQEEKALNLIVDKSRKIGLVAKYHNLPIKYLYPLLIRLESENKVNLETNEANKLVLIGALLQYGDAIDMSKSRVDLAIFKDKLNDISNLDTKRFDLMHKMFRSYLIDKIETFYDPNLQKFFTIKFFMSASEADLNNHPDYLHSIKKEYVARLERNDKDCLKIIEKALNISVKIECIEEVITANSQKIRIPDKFYEIKSYSNPSINDLLKSTIETINGESILTYIKFFSANSQVFFDGLANIGRISEESKKVMIKEDEDIKQKIENYLFIETDWNINRNVPFKYSIVGQSGQFGITNKFNIASYLDYFRYYKNKGIKCEFHFPLKYFRKPFAFINLHYDRILNDQDIEILKDYCESTFESFGLKFFKIFEDSLLPNYISAINNFKELSTQSKKIIIELFTNIFAEYPVTKDILTYISIYEFKQLLHDYNYKIFDNDFYVKINKSIFQEYVALSKNPITSTWLEINWYITTERRIRECKI
jgi:hypothetical protein